MTLTELITAHQPLAARWDGMTFSGRNEGHRRDVLKLANELYVRTFVEPTAPVFPRDGYRLSPEQCRELVLALLDQVQDGRKQGWNLGADLAADQIRKGEHDLSWLVMQLVCINLTWEV